MKMFSSPFLFGGSAGFAGNLGSVIADADEIQYRLSGAMETRSTESIAQILSRLEEGDCIRLAPDTWSYDTPLVITKSCAIIGSPLGTKIRRGEGLKSGPLVDIQADNVVLANIYFEDTTSLTDIVAVSSSGRNNVFISQCAMMNFSIGIQNTGGSFHSYAFNSIAATQNGIDIDGQSQGNKIIGNSIAMTPAINLSVDMGENVSGTAVTGNVCTLSPGNYSISFFNTGGAQTFAAVGGLGNHVAGNVATLQEVT